MVLTLALFNKYAEQILTLEWKTCAIKKMKSESGNYYCVGLFMYFQ